MKQINISLQKKILLIIVTLFWFAQYVYIPYQTPYLSSTGVLASYIGIIVGAYGFSQMILRIPVGILADRKGNHKPFILIGVLFSGTASLFRIFLANGTGFFLGSIFSGMASAMWISFMVLFFSYYSKEQKKHASGIIVVANNLGIFIGFLIGTLLHDSIGIKGLCILGVFSVVPAFLAGILIQEPEKRKDVLPVKELLKVINDRQLILFSLIALIQQGVQISTAMSFTTQVAKNLGATGMQIGICSIIYILAAVFSSTFASSKLAHRKETSFWIPLILLCMTAYCLLVPNLPVLYLLYPVQILAGLSTGILFSYCTSEAMKNVPQEKASTAMGFYQAVYAIGMTVFPMVTGLIADHSSVRTAYYILAFLTLFGFVAASLHYRERNRKFFRNTQT